MDNLTHTFTGLCLSRAGLNRFTPLATPILLTSANLPDADIVSLLRGSESYLHWHRNWTHSLLAAPVLAILLALAFRFFRPSLPLLPAFLISLCGIASHLLLDLTNVYGVRILLPFSAAWFEWDLTPVIDFWIWGAFAVAVAAPLLSRLVGSEIGERRGLSNGKGAAIAALLFVTAYNGGRAVLHSRVLAELNSREYAGTAALRVAAFPASMNPLKWRGVAETASDYLLFDLNLPAAFDPSTGETITKAQPSPAITASSKTSAFRVLAEFAQYPVYREIPRKEGGATVQLSDLRFGFTSTAYLDRANRIESSVFQFGAAAPR